MVLVDLIYNLALLVALSVVSGFVDSRWKRNTWIGASLQGLVFGGAALIGMLRPFVFAPGLIFDGRSVMISLGGLFFGPWTAGVACLMTIPARVFQGGPGTAMGVLVVVSAALIGIWFHGRWGRRPEEVKASRLLWFGFLVHLAMLAMALVLPPAMILPVLKNIGWPVILTYPLATVLIGKILSDQASRGAVVERLKESEEQFRLIMENLADLVAVLDLDGCRIYNSPSYQSILGDSEKLRGSSSFDQVHPEDRAMVRQAFEETVRTGIGQRLDYRLVDQFGEVRHIESQGSVIRDSQNAVAKVLVVSRDITTRKQSEERLQASERKYRELVEHANSIILRWTRDGRILFLNEYGQKFFGYMEEEIRGRHVIGTITPETESSGRHLPSLINQVCGDPVAFEQNVNENIRRNGERVWIAWTNKMVLDKDGQVTEILSIGSDITKRKLAEEEISRLHQELQSYAQELEQRVLVRTTELAEALNRAEAADRTKSAFLAAMSHELRTPLNSIIGFTGLLLQGLAGPCNPEQIKQLRMVKESGQHLLALINDVLDISKIEAGQIEIRCATFDLGESIRKVANTISPLAEKKHLGVAVRVAPELGSITSDRRRFEQILLNLLSNAIKFTDQGQITITAEAASGLPGSGGPAFCVAVADTGMGMKAEDLDLLFQPFRQLDTGLTRLHEGTGLGLAICKRLTERLGGTISVESQWGKGSVFRCTLPIHLDPHESHHPDH